MEETEGTEITEERAMRIEDLRPEDTVTIEEVAALLVAEFAGG